jgi:serine/threonine protein kinase/Tfp pilus assembly protein PilF
MKIGETISHYTLIEKIGQGGMGLVFKAEDTILHRTVALKFLVPQVVGTAEEKKRFLHEAQTAAALDHPNICTVHEIDESDEFTFISMAYIDGQNLSERIKRGPLKLDTAVDTAIQIAEGLKAAHEKGIVHRDIKSANIMVDSRGHVRITDFGLAQLSGRTRLTKTGSTPGTISYMSPEQTRGEGVDHRTDIWSFGVLLYEMMTGQLPFKGDYEQAVVYSIINEQAPAVAALRSDIPSKLEQIVNKCLAKSPDERYQHVDDMIADLKHVRKESKDTLPLQTTTSSSSVSRKKKLKLVLIPFILTLLFIICYFIISPILFKNEIAVKPKPIAVIGFENQTGDDNYDYLQKVIPNLLITNLEQSKYLHVLTWERMQDLLKQMGKEQMDIIDKETGFQLCQAEGVETVVLGSFAKAGNMFVTDIKVLNALTKQILKSANVKGIGEESILANQIDELSNEIIKSIGISDSDIAENPLHISEVTTTSLDAYNYYLKGKNDRYTYLLQDAQRAFQKAVSLDSTFAMAHLNLGLVNRMLGNNDTGRENFENAMKYAINSTEKERLIIEANYAHYIQKNPDEKLRLYLEILKKFPQEKEVCCDIGMYFHLKGRFAEAIKYYEKTLTLDPNYPDALNWGAYAYSKLKNYDKSLELLQRYARIFPGNPNPIGSMADIYFHMGNLESAISKIQEMIEIKPDFSFYWGHGYLAYYYALKEDYNETFNWINQWTLEKSATAFWWKGLYLYWAADYANALNVLDEASKLGWRSQADWLRGWIYLDTGEYQLSRKYFESYFNPDNLKNPRRTAHYRLCLGYLDLKLNQLDAAHTKLTEVQTILGQPDDFNKIEISFYHDLLRAEVFIAQDRAENAIEICSQLKPLEFGTPMGEVVQSDFLYYNLPFPRDVLARAYIQISETGKAITEYERLMDVTDLQNKERRLIRPEFHYRLAQLYEKQGKISKAIRHYKRYVNIGNITGRYLVHIINAEEMIAKMRSNSK